MPESKEKSFKLSLKISNTQRLVLGSFFIIFSIFLFLSIISYFFSREIDQSTIYEFTDRKIKTRNLLSKSGAWVSHFLVYNGFGLSSIIFAWLVGLSGLNVLIKPTNKKIYRNWIWGIFVTIWLSIFFGFFHSYPILGGMIGFEINLFFQDYIGKTGLILLLLLGLIFYFSIRFGLTIQHIINFFNTKKLSKIVFVFLETF